MVILLLKRKGIGNNDKWRLQGENNMDTVVVDLALYRRIAFFFLFYKNNI